MGLPIDISNLLLQLDLSELKYIANFLAGQRNMEEEPRTTLFLNLIRDRKILNLEQYVQLQIERVILKSRIYTIIGWFCAIIGLIITVPAALTYFVYSNGQIETLILFLVGLVTFILGMISIARGCNL